MVYKFLNTKVEIYIVPILGRYFEKYTIFIIDKDFISNNHITYINNKDKFEQEIYLHSTETGLNFIEFMKSYLEGMNFC